MCSSDLGRCIRIGHWEALIGTLAAACFGLACALAAEEVSDWTGWYTWSQETYWTYPPNWIRVFGILILVGVNLLGFRSGA